MLVARRLQLARQVDVAPLGLERHEGDRVGHCLAVHLLRGRVRVRVMVRDRVRVRVGVGVGVVVGVRVRPRP